MMRGRVIDGLGMGVEDWVVSGKVEEEGEMKEEIGWKVLT